MKAPYSWIKEFLDIDLPAEKVAEKLNETGIETTVSKFGEYIPNIITVKILDVKKHPEKDKLFICKATDGTKEYEVITGASNVEEGKIAVLAKEGAVIQGKEIKPVNFGSFKSEGMFLSLEELGIEESSEGILLLPDDVSVGVDANDVLDLGKDDIFEIEITPNRGDALSIRGLAREIGAIFGIKRKEKFPLVSIAEEIPVNIEALTDKVYRYRGIIVKDVHVKESPWDIQLKLIKSGHSPINNIVDITNYILLQEGQPLHAFDLSKIKGKIIIRNAKDGEKIETLDGEEKELSSADIVIADEEKPLAIAGVIGGNNSKIEENTTEILLEAAVFDNISVRKTAKRLAINTDSSYRFERGVDIENLPNAQDKALELILKTAGGKALGEKDLYTKPYTPKEVKLKEITTKRILGELISKDESAEILNRLEIPTKTVEDGVISKIPAFRALDLEREIDLVEEVGRVKGFNNLKTTYPSVSIEGFDKSDEYLFQLRTRDFFKDNGLYEVVTYTFVSEDIYNIFDLPVPEIRIENYLLKIQSVMRDNLAVSLVGVLQENMKFQNKDLSIFEISSTFFKDFEEIRAGILLSGKFIDGFYYKKGKEEFSTSEKWDFLKAKGIFDSYFSLLGIEVEYKISELPYLHPYQSADIYVDEKKIGYIGKIHPKKASTLKVPQDTFLGELKLRYISRDIEDTRHPEDYLYEIYKNKPAVVFKELPKFPAVKRDLAFVVDETLELDKLIKELKRSSKLIEEVKLFDIYFIGEGKKSVAFNLTFRDENKSLSDEEVNEIVKNIVDNLKTKFKGLQLREG